MTETTQEITQPTQDNWIPVPADRCDSASCPAQAHVKVSGVSGELFFCAHHYESIVSTDKGRQSIVDFAFSVIDHREKLIENRLQGED